jgi:hypothetical protein
MSLAARLSFRLNLQSVHGRPGQTLLEAILPHLNVPTLCGDPVLAPGQDCRLCAVEVPALGGLVLACQTVLEEGLEVWTHTKAVRQARLEALGDIVSRHQGDCLFCERSKSCKLQALCQDLHLSSLGPAARAPRLTLVGGGLRTPPPPRPEVTAPLVLTPSPPRVPRPDLDIKKLVRAALERAIDPI